MHAHWSLVNLDRMVWRHGTRKVPGILRHGLPEIHQRLQSNEKLTRGSNFNRGCNDGPDVVGDGVFQDLAG
jgi:hypothetical protein